MATHGTPQVLERVRIPADRLNKVAEGSPHVVEALRDGSIQLVVNTTRGAKEIRDSYSIRRNALLSGVPYFTTMSAALAGVDSLEANDNAPASALPTVRSLQEWAAPE